MQKQILCEDDNKKCNTREAIADAAEFFVGD
jgi:hypothetical protein